MSPRILVVYYSRTGNTRNLAHAIASAVGGDVEEIVDRTKRVGVLGYLRSALEAALQRTTEIGASVHDPESYDLVVVGSPVWNMSLSSPVRAYLRRHRGRLRATAFFGTYGGAGCERTFAQMARACGSDPVATLSVREADLERSAAEVQRFAAKLRRATGAGVSATSPPAPTPIDPTR